MELDEDMIMNSIGLCPEMNLETLKSPELLTLFGIWPEIRGWREMQQTPRYFEGR